MSGLLQLPGPTVVSFRRALRLLAGQAVGFRVTRAWLLEQRLPANAVYPVLAALRFFELLDDSQQLTSGLDSFLQDKPARQRVVQAAYAPVLEQLRLPVDNRKQLIEQLEGRVKAARSLLPLTATFMAWAMAYAGEPILRHSPTHRPGPRPGVLRREQGLDGEPTRIEAARIRGRDGRRPLRPDVGFTIQVTRDTSEEEIERMLERIERVWTRRRGR